MLQKTAVILIGAFILVGVLVAATDEIPETITLKGERKAAVEFPHVIHHNADIECMTCHHNMTEDMELPSQACRECHTPDSEVKSMKAFHDNCIPCHRTENKENGLKLPVKCNDCHVE